MRKFCFNKPFLAGLITAFLFLQWSATHIHLAGEHDHGDGSHQHTVTTHQHQFTHHADAIDVANDVSFTDTLSHADSNKVVDVEYVCTQFHGNLAKFFAVVPSIDWNNSEFRISLTSTIPLFQQNTYQTYHQYTSVRLRAPPVLS